MKIDLKQLLAGAGLIVATTAVTALNVTGDALSAEGFSTLGHNLSTNQRDFRLNNGFADPTANDNNTPHVNFPGEVGATMAIWKGAIEWGSLPHGPGGTGDPIGGNVLGSGGANFDPSFQGNTTGTTGFNNIVSVLTGFSGSTLAFQQGGGSGWNIRFYDGHVWDDGPGSVPGSRYDIQSVMCHEYGHALGLGHTGTGGATMFASIGGGSEAERSIASDDIAGVQAIYGVASASKPVITGTSGSTSPGGTLTISGSNFSATGNDVWFTNLAQNGTILKVTGLPSSGTSIDVIIPATAIDGDILVQKNASGHSSLSNAWPFNFDDGAPAPPLATSVNPNTGPNAGWTPVTINGINFTGATAVQFGANDVQSFNVVNDGVIQAVTPPGTLNDVVDITVTGPAGVGVSQNLYTYGTNPFINVDNVTPDHGPAVGGTTVTITGPNVVPVFWVNFDGVGATDIIVESNMSMTCVTPPGTPGATVDVFYQGSGFETLVDAFTYDPFGGTYGTLLPGLAGGFGEPLFSGSGDLTPGGAGAVFDITNVAPNAGGVWFIGLTEAALPLEGGTLFVFPWLVEVPIVVNGSGSLSLPLTVPPAAAGLSIVNQAWFFDATGPFGYTATNGLVANVP